MPSKYLVALALGALLTNADALSGRGAFVFSEVVKVSSLKSMPCPGHLGNKDTRCASGKADKGAVQSKLSHYKGWKQTDPWKAGSTGFTSTGKDLLVVTLINPIGSKKGTLLIFSEF